MKSRSLLLLSFVVSLCLPALRAEETPTITIRKSDAINLAIAGIGGGDGAAVGGVLKNDLTLAGVFAIGLPATASYIVSGTAGGGTLQASVKIAAAARCLRNPIPARRVPSRTSSPTTSFRHSRAIPASPRRRSPSFRRAPGERKFTRPITTVRT